MPAARIRCPKSHTDFVWIGVLLPRLKPAHAMAGREEEPLLGGHQHGMCACGGPWPLKGLEEWALLHPLPHSA